ncbi:MAG TPA: YkgJ family cysteine cluster protein [Flavipsychrobacter sp.]|jgi:hypothetical protein|nr:YkgJ family cysteine cluster protein [Flavipsychrobacter sp.]
MLPANWEKFAQAHQKNYQQLLKKISLPGSKKLRNIVLDLLPELHDTAFAQIDCLQCGNCCKNHSPRFKQPDIKRIAKRLKIKEGELIQRFLKLDEENDYVTQRNPCPFLNEDNTCKIYDDRPSDCARYPYTDEDVLLDRPSLTVKNTTVCPITFQVLEAILLKVGNK